MKKKHGRLHRGFTLTELIIAITISVLIMGGVVKFLTILQQDILTSKNTTAVHTSLTDFWGIMRNLSKLYSSGSIIVWGSGSYNVWLLLLPDKTSWVLIGVVEEKTGNTSRLDPVANKDIYWKKVIATQKLTTSQISSILTSSAAAYGVDFFDEGLMRDLPVKSFTITPYNSWVLMEYAFEIETPFYENLKGKSRLNISPEVITFPYTLDF